MTTLTLDKITFQELININNNLYLPLRNFNSLRDFKNICSKMKLSNGKFFPLPILFGISKLQKGKIEKFTKIKLLYRKRKIGTLENFKIFSIDKKKHLKNIYGTKDEKHPGIKFFLNNKNYFIYGKIKIDKEIKKKYSISKLKKKLQKLKEITGYHTRNIPHKAHEWIIDFGLSKTGAILINPMTGQLKKGDFKRSAVNKSFKILIKSKYKNNKNVFYKNLLTYARYAGPREALFHAIIRKNLGCTHFLVGRDHAGVGNYYSKYASQKICVKFQKNLGIRILGFKEPFYCKYCKKVINSNCLHRKFKNYKVFISGTKIRKKILLDKIIPQKFLDIKISKILNKNSIRGFSNN
ncbi:MAG: hypothetical protein CBC82_07515 [Cellvibrionales bacterium TMED122]|nr:MAG: hypothetical protein CBC82_07515 [Cellvibrionales bacterium TMED122]